MHIEIEWRTGKYPSFNIHLASKEGKDAFMTIRGCKIIESEKGQFVSFPAKKMDDGKYWNHVWATSEFNELILKKAKSAPAAAPRQQAKPADPLEGMDDDIPF